MEPERQQTIDDQLESGKSPGNPALARILEWCKNFARAIAHTVSTKEGGQQKEFSRKKDGVRLEIQQINIQELCQLSPEDFLSNSQFFKLLKMYNLLNRTGVLDIEERQEDESASEFIVGGVLTMFIMLRNDLGIGSPEEKMLSEFTSKVLKYLHDKNKPDEEGTQQKADSLKESREDRLGRLVGTPDVIRRFGALGVILSHRNDGGYDDWCVFSSPTATGHIVALLYGRALKEMTHRQMSLIEMAFRSGVLTRDSFIMALKTGQPSFDNLLKL